MRWEITCDGTSLGMGGAIGIGVILCAPDGTRHTISRRSDRRGCSNAAEALALISALDEAARLGARELSIACDNSILIAQTIGTGRTKVPRLAPLYAEARQRLKGFAHVQLAWIPRHRNSGADALARAALGLSPKPSVPNNRRKTKRW